MIAAGRQAHPRADARRAIISAAFSGNKFGVILKQLHARRLGDRRRAAARRRARRHDATAAGPVAVTVTIGGVTAPRHARTVEEILARAQDALDAARAKRHGSFVAYRPNVERDALRRENRARHRRDRRARSTSGASRSPSSRWCDGATPQRRVLRMPDAHPPRRRHAWPQANEIIPVAERLGLVRLLDHRVLELVVDELAAAPDLQASVNVSPASTIDPGLVAGPRRLLRAQSGRGERLTIEITETAAIQDIDDTRGFVARVKDLGCRIAIDDFGAGYTSFRNLRKLGVDIIKIDGAFVQNIMRSEDDRAFVRTLIDLARRLGLKTVAEWVQDEEAAQHARRLGLRLPAGRADRACLDRAAVGATASSAGDGGSA